MGGEPDRRVSVSGGAGGIEAHTQDLTELARLFGQAATDTGGSALALHAYLADLGIGLSSAFDPSGAAAFELALASALDGPAGVSLLALRCGVLDANLRAAAAAYLSADRLYTAGGPVLRGVVKLPAALVCGVATAAGNGDPGINLSAVLTADPELLDVAVDAARGSPAPATVALQGAPADGHPVVRRAGPDPDADADGPPRSFADIMAGLARRNDGRHGEIDVRRLVGADGRVSYIVDIPGTKSWTPLPTSDVTSLNTNLLAVRGATSSYERGVLEAMAAAGIAGTDPVMLVGHSQGGMIAVNAAAACAHSGRFNVTNVVTAGAPIGMTVPRLTGRVQVLALENRGDVVPHADGLDNAPRPNVTTVTVDDHDHHGVGANHDLELSYVPGAADVDHSRDPSVLAYRASAAPFLDAAAVTTTRFVIGRGY